MRKHLIAIWLLLFWGTHAHAYHAPYGIANLGSIDFTTFLNRTYIDNATNSASRRATSSTVVARNQSTRAKLSTPAKLASSYPANERADVEKVFRDMLVGYAGIEQQFDIPKDDLAGALAAFLAGNYMAYHNTDFPDASFKPLVNQMRLVISQRAEFNALRPTEKRDLFETLAILGMYGATTQMALKRTPNANVEARMREGGRRYLAHFLGDGVDSVSITDQGLTFGAAN